MKIIIEINVDGEAFFGEDGNTQDAGAITETLRREITASKIEQALFTAPAPIFDFNGNRCGIIDSDSE